ncbi:hypothetical protein GCM10011511_46330 [Puia dinghuensis]|uniref:TonB-dependent receptor plug domain-containing protein n=2 Tax=Puia dinghuensis TaxID=1792502 RepID=A0A8J2UH85_9BACT|nr:hypothetical protein GCM10011511_46330 [Puia dinghuensis]
MTLLPALTGWSQRDSARIDIGWLSLDKGLTQTLTIKGAALEKMPFTNLSDAIAAWFYGAYTQPMTVAYVVDGNPVTDVDIYPIFDIEEVTLVEHAAGAAAYGGTQQELVVITTKRGKGKSGLRVAGQAGIVNANGNGYNTFNRAYHQYYLGAYRNLDKVSVGVSADWVRDVLPEHDGAQVHVTTPVNLQRWRLNGYFTWRPAKGNVVELRMGYAPQSVKVDLDTVSYQTSYHVTRDEPAHLLMPSLAWYSDLLPGLTNTLQAQYLEHSENFSYQTYDSSLTTPQRQVTFVAAETAVKVSQLLVRDRLSYDLRAGNWHFVPAVNFLYEHIHEKSAYATGYYGIAGFSNLTTPQPPALGSFNEQKGDLLYLSPGAELRFGRAFDLQGGVQMNLSHGRDSGSRTVYPYVGLGVDVLRFNQKAGGASLRFFGSYAQRPRVFVDDYSLSDFYHAGAPYSLADVNHPKFVNTSFGFGTTINTYYVRLQPPPVYWTEEAGATFTTANGQWQLGYTYQRRQFTTPGELGTIGNGPDSSAANLLEWKSTLHHIDVRFKVVDRTGVVWQTGLNATAVKYKNYTSFPPFFGSLFFSYSSYPPTGDLDNEHLSWTGGWVNRWQVQDFTAGLDLLYHFGQPTQIYANNYTVEGPKLNSVLVPNIYMDYRWRLPHAQVLELFVESRGLVRSKSSDLLDNRRYYTVGGSFSL